MRLTCDFDRLVTPRRGGQRLHPAGRDAQQVVRGRPVSRPAVAGEVLASAAGPRSSRPNPSSARTLADPGAVQRGSPAASRALISYTDRPWRRSSTARPRARSFFGALVRPGLPGSANSVTLPARKSRTSEASALRV